MDTRHPIEVLAAEVESCRKCSLARTRTHVVFGTGDPSSRIVFVGEAPGFNEDRQGVPFCGKAGRVLDELLAAVGLARKSVYIANILKCRPPGNRDPLLDEIALCTPYLARQIQIIRPEVICCLGRFSLAWVCRHLGIPEPGSISRVHGRVFSTGEDLFGRVSVVALYHPAVATYNPAAFAILKRDFAVLKTL